MKGIKKARFHFRSNDLGLEQLYTTVKSLLPCSEV